MIKKMLPVLAILPMAIGALGYILAGEMFSNALYAAFALYFTNPISDAYNIFVEAARWTAPLVTATAILCVLQSVWDALRYRIKLLRKKDSVAVYSDSECHIEFSKDVSVIYPGDRFKSYARSHIMMFSSDEKNLQFYEEHKDELADGEVFIAIKDIECSFLNSLGNITVFDINATIAGMLWKEISLWNIGFSVYNIVIWGDNILTGNIISTGLQLNLFSRNQKVIYHVITDNANFKVRHSELRLMNNDEIHYHNKDDSNIWNLISEADIVIVPDVPDAEMMQTIVVKAGDSKVYYYSPHSGDLVSYFSQGSIIPFGRDDMVFTDDNIRRFKLFCKAVKLNEHYANLYNTERNWNALSGFLKGSNISAAAFGEVLFDLNSRISEEEQAELEHIRWCRFYFLNYYTFGIPKNGKKRDDKRRIHKDLVAYNELDQAEKLKDLDAIRITRDL